VRSKNSEHLAAPSGTRFSIQLGPDGADDSRVTSHRSTTARINNAPTHATPGESDEFSRDAVFATGETGSGWHSAAGCESKVSHYMGSIKYFKNCSQSGEAVTTIKRGRKRNFCSLFLVEARMKKLRTCNILPATMLLRYSFGPNAHVIGCCASQRFRGALPPF